MGGSPRTQDYAGGDRRSSHASTHAVNIVAMELSVTGRVDDPLLALLAEVADAARSVPLAHQPPKLQDALVALGLAESHLITSLTSGGDYGDAGASSP